MGNKDLKKRLSQLEAMMLAPEIDVPVLEPLGPNATADQATDHYLKLMRQPWRPHSSDLEPFTGTPEEATAAYLRIMRDDDHVL